MQAACLRLKADKTLKSSFNTKMAKHSAELLQHRANPTRMMKKKKHLVKYYL